MRHILANLRKTIQENALIHPHDRVAVGLSGGKDSMLLLYALKRFLAFSPIPFELGAFFVDLGFEAYPFEVMDAFCREINVPLTRIETSISTVIFDVRKESNPCSLCANMRRGALHKAVKAQGYNVLALGHHENDAVETLMMNMVYTGRISTFKMKTYLSRQDLWVIRPMIHLKESRIIEAVSREKLPVIKNPCPMDEATARLEMKAFLVELYRKFPQARKNFVTAINNPDQVQLVLEKKAAQK
ncbi:MAG: adenine nucleotide alpha hydrolase [delta proteobacterium ML8_F1]|nr:MAG: adenine nucleotide alpha hydrolase [delta proteobacterium ML8_F1]